MSETKLLLDAVTEVARMAGSKALELFNSQIAVEIKGDGSPVTIADKSAEASARQWIMKRFPDDGILGEESGVHKPDADRRWIVDPIDGTKAFIRGVPFWGTLVAVARGEDILAGAVCVPALGEMLAAAQGEGCWFNGSRVRVSGKKDLATATVLTTDERFQLSPPEWLKGWRALADKASLSRTWGDCYGYVLLATGRAEVMVDPVMSPWDAAALMPAIVEAGGVFTDWSGRQTAFGGSVIATNAALAGEARSVLGAAGVS